ncbi:MAG: HAMP domain-containing histidine kinase [Bacteroidetes bacterium]|nr:HAMP domain-containing histidine kinase [Bacteroidota bacterium]
MTDKLTSLRLKTSLILVAIIIASGTLYYTQNLVSKLQQREREIVELYAKGIEYVANTTAPNVDITFLFDNIIRPIDFPIILTDANNNINLINSENVRNLPFDSSMTLEERKEYFAEILIKMDEVHKPIIVSYADTVILTKIHYGDSNLITRLKFYPYLQIIIAALFIFLGYIGFSNIRTSEQRYIWVGMAKETAHQLGTPVSSLMGWVEMLRLNYKDGDKVLDISDEIGSDVEKLNKITYRFSKIGSKPELKKANVFKEINNVIKYFERRLPQTGKKVDLIIKGNKKICAGLNSSLFEWVIENLVKNALDAIGNKNGKIEIIISSNNNNVEIDFCDNGKGIDMKRRKDVFRPGYSTKRRGWGLGLSLSKRIIENYHKGKIFVKNSSPGQGTTFKIILKAMA